MEGERGRGGHGRRQRYAIGQTAKIDQQADGKEPSLTPNGGNASRLPSQALCRLLLREADGKALCRPLRGADGKECPMPL